MINNLRNDELRIFCLEDIDTETHEGHLLFRALKLLQYKGEHDTTDLSCDDIIDLLYDMED